jgi:hypothetical protein
MNIRQTRKAEIKFEKLMEFVFVGRKLSGALGKIG